MKKRIVFLLLLFSLGAMAQTDTSRIEYFDLPDSTALGIPDGRGVAKEIGPGGGMITSEDGRIELIFPAGALTSNTPITIKTTTNPLPNGVGKAYQFEPSGIQFTKGVNLIFHYSAEEADVCPPELMAFGLQDHTGKWSFMDYENWDSLSKTLSGNIRHFSGQAIFNQMQLIPKSQELRVGDTLTIHVAIANPKNPNIKEFPDARIEETQTAIWYVNNIPNGGMAYGRTEALPPQFRSIYADYFAPYLLPDKNPVIIQVVLLVLKGKRLMPQKSFTCSIKLYDEYKILIRDTIEARVGEGTFIADSGSFIARVTPKDITITEIKNYPPYSYIKHKPPFGRLSVIVTGYKGPVHIGKTKYNGELLSYSQAVFIETDKPQKVLINFDTQENNAFKYIYSLAGVKMVEDVPIESVPDLVSFYVNGKPQTYQVDSRSGSEYTIYVQRNGNARNLYPR